MAVKLADETQKALDAFNEKDEEFQKAWALFERTHDKELIILEMLRESRNAALDNITRLLRTEADDAGHKEKILKIPPFTATKKSSSLFHADMLLARINEMDLFDAAKAVGAIEVTTTVKYKEMKQFLTDKGVYPEFEDCEDIVPMTTAISGPKPLAAFGGELKKK